MVGRGPESWYRRGGGRERLLSLTTRADSAARSKD